MPSVFDASLVRSGSVVYVNMVGTTGKNMVVSKEIIHKRLAQNKLGVRVLCFHCWRNASVQVLQDQRADIAREIWV
mgnify:CR=1 FL=1